MTPWVLMRFPSASWPFSSRGTWGTALASWWCMTYPALAVPPCTAEHGWIGCTWRSWKSFLVLQMPWVQMIRQEYRGIPWDTSISAPSNIIFQLRLATTWESFDDTLTPTTETISAEASRLWNHIFTKWIGSHLRSVQSIVQSSKQ